MADVTFQAPDLSTFARLDALGLQATGQFLEPDRAVLACRVVDRDATCGRCGEQGRLRDSTTRRLAHEPLPLATDDPARHDPPLPLRGVWTRVATGHVAGR